MRKKYLMKHLELNLENKEQLMRVSRALSSMERLRILELLNEFPHTVAQIAEKLNIPASTAALNVRILEEANLIQTEIQRGARGNIKISSRTTETVGIRLMPLAGNKNGEAEISVSMPIGGYSLAGGIQATCGMANVYSEIGEQDNPLTIFSTERFAAQIIWFRRGFLEYHFSVMQLSAIDVHWVEISFEACSEAPMYRDPWESDIAVSVNGVQIGIWRCPCDCGGRRGKLNPVWWSDLNTQFGFLKTWRIDQTGTYLDKIHISNVTIDDVRLYQNEFISVRIEALDNECPGGLNLFGERFGDYSQPIVMKIGYTMKN